MRVPYLVLVPYGPANTLPIPQPVRFSTTVLSWDTASCLLMCQLPSSGDDSPGLTACLHGAWPPGGDASLQNALDACVDMLKAVPPYGQREVLVLAAALSTVDPGDIFASIKACKEARIRYVCEGMCGQHSRGRLAGCENAVKRSETWMQEVEVNRQVKALMHVCCWTEFILAVGTGALHAYAHHTMSLSARAMWTFSACHVLAHV